MGCRAYYLDPIQVSHTRTSRTALHDFSTTLPVMSAISPASAGSQSEPPGSVRYANFPASAEVIGGCPEKSSADKMNCPAMKFLRGTQKLQKGSSLGPCPAITNHTHVTWPGLLNFMAPIHGLKVGLLSDRPLARRGLVDWPPFSAGPFDLWVSA